MLTMAAIALAALAGSPTAPAQPTAKMPAARPGNGSDIVPLEAPPALERPAAQPLSGDALRNLLRDAYVTPVRTPGLVSNPAGEVFMYNGAYERRNIGRRRLQGTYSIEENAVCVEVPESSKWCRRVFTALDGVIYLFVNSDDGSAATMTVTRLP